MINFKMILYIELFLFAQKNDMQNIYFLYSGT